MPTIKVEAVTIDGTWRGQPCKVTFLRDGSREQVVELRVGDQTTAVTIDRNLKPCATVAAGLIEAWLPVEKKPARKPKPTEFVIEPPCVVLRVFGRE